MREVWQAIPGSRSSTPTTIPGLPSQETEIWRGVEISASDFVGGKIVYGGPPGPSHPGEWVPRRILPRYELRIFDRDWFVRSIAYVTIGQQIIPQRKNLWWDPDLDE